ncbi:MAG: ribosomal protein S18-alanine N-acetyltransferase [Clostridium sp.]|nr:ribosomal protein S18-alanine N-acetyltransferase [Clostridium sp.]
MKKKRKTCEVELLPLTSEFCEPVYGIAAQSLPEHWSLQSVRDILLYDNNIFYVAMHKETNLVVGFAGIMTIVDEAELLNIAVLPEYRENGIAQMLLERMFEKAEEHGAGRMLLEVRKSNHPARHLYEKNGFTPFAERKGYYNHPKEDAVLMEKRL